uniref:Uncharacterized protein n=1 Tax=Kalanchoe fedtschenkoi TaxID=63787 RepID=A0A7N0V7E0_KALFE
MIRRANQSKHGAPPADLLVCFPSRAHLTLMPNQTCTIHRLRRLKKLPSTRLGSVRVGQTSSPVSWAKPNAACSDASEPTSPKVTCAGQIKVRPRAAATCKRWQSVMEEIERIHKNNKKQKKRASWGDALGFKKEVMQFLTCLRNIKIDFRCFGAMPECDLSSDEDDDDEDEADEANHERDTSQMENKEDVDESEKNSKAVFSKWFMVMQENEEPATTQNEKETDAPTAAPPPNALLLMRCRSAPANSWLETKAMAVVEQEERERRRQQNEEEEEQRIERREEEAEEKQRKKLRDYLVVMEYDTDFYKLSSDIAKETWVVGSINPKNPFSRSRSWKR